MQKKVILVFIFLLIFITACDAPSDFYEKYDGIPFEKYDVLEYGGKTYDLLLAVNVEDSLAYYYKHIENKSSKETWIVNYSDRADYIGERVLADDLCESIYNTLLPKKSDLEVKIGSSIFIHKNGESIILESVLKNDSKKEMGCIIIGQYLPIIIVNNYERYLVFVPINAYICLYNDNMVYDFMGYEVISIDELVTKFKILER